MNWDKQTISMTASTRFLGYRADIKRKHHSGLSTLYLLKVEQKNEFPRRREHECDGMARPEDEFLGRYKVCKYNGQKPPSIPEQGRLSGKPDRNSPV